MTGLKKMTGLPVILNGTAAGSVMRGVLDIYAQGTERAKALGQIAKLSIELKNEHDELQRIYTEIGRMYYDQAKAAPEGPFVPLFDQANRTAKKAR